MRAATVASALALAAALGTPSAAAKTEDIIAPSDPDHPTADSGWQAATCQSDSPECSVESPTSQFFEPAAGHPPVGFTQFIVESEPDVGPEKPVGSLKTVRVDLPAGLTVNPQATEQCTQEEFEGSPEFECPGAAVGTSFVTGSALGVPSLVPISATVYNIVPPDGEPARFGFHLADNEIYLRADVAWESDYHEGFTIDVPPAPLGEDLILKNRLVFDGTSGGTFITTPTTCLGEATPTSPFKHVYSTWLLASSVDEEAEPGYEFPRDARPPLEARIARGTSPKECDSIPFDPSLSADPRTDRTDSPSGASIDVRLPEVEGAENQSTSHVRSARVTLPLGMGLNPSAAGELETCRDDQFNKGSRAPVTCPSASRIGTVEVDTPPLPDGSLSGPVYVGRQLSRDPGSGDLYRIFVNPKSQRYGIDARLLGRVAADPETGRVATSFDDGPLGGVPLAGLPQVPFKSFRIELDGGPRAALTSPSTCGPHTVVTEMTPWSGNPAARAAGEFSLASLPGGGGCPRTLAGRPFSPRFGAGVDSSRAGAFSPLGVEIARGDGEQELKGVDLTLPAGLSARLAGVAYCPEAALAAAAARGGGEEDASPSCPASSLIGSADVVAGSGPAPIRIGGKAYLAGPYRGAPLSLAVLTPAVAGPFDLGTVAVRTALFVDPRTAQVRAVSDPIPHVYGGATLHVRSVSVRVDRSRFTLNPSGCQPRSFSGSLLGGGGDPTDPGAFSSTAVSAPFQAFGCGRLGFRPRFFMRLFGAMRRAHNPRLRVVVLPRAGNANIARAATILPRSLILDQSNLAKVCTRVQFAARNCPRRSIYGHARAFSPLLDKPLKGPVYLRSSDNTLPDLVAALRGQVEVELVGRTDSVRGRIRNIFDIVPDVPVSKFVFILRGGRRGLLVNSRHQCRRSGARAMVRLRAQNSRRRIMRLRLRTPCRQRHRAQRRHR